MSIRDAFECVGAGLILLSMWGAFYALSVMLTLVLEH